MGYTTTYDDLVEEVQVIVESTNDEYVEQLPRIIARAHDQVQRDLDLAMWHAIVPIANATSRILTRDLSWLKVLSIYIPSTGKFVEKRSLDYVRACGGVTGVPKYWADQSETEILIVPAPTVAAPVSFEVDTLKRLASIDEDNQESWITKNAADLLLLQTLIGSEVFLVGGERVTEFAALYKLIVTSAVDELRGTGRNEYEPTREASKPSLEKTT